MEIYRCTNPTCSSFNQRFNAPTQGNYVCPNCMQSLSYEKPPEEPTTGGGALAGMIAGGTLGLVGGPVGVIIGGILGALLGDQVEREGTTTRRQNQY